MDDVKDPITEFVHFLNSLKQTVIRYEPIEYVQVSDDLTRTTRFALQINCLRWEVIPTSEIHLKGITPDIIIKTTINSKDLENPPKYFVFWINSLMRIVQLNPDYIFSSLTNPNCSHFAVWERGGATSNVSPNIWRF